MFAALFEGFAQINAEALPDGVLPKNKRQVAGTGATTTTTASPTTMSSSDTSTQETTPSPTSASPTSASPTSTPDQTSSPLTTSQSVETTAFATTSPVVTTDSRGSTVTSSVVTSATVTRTSARTSSSDIVDLGSTTINRSTLSSAVTVTSALVASNTVPTTFISSFTRDGQVFTTGISTNQLVATTTGFATSTISPSLQDGGSSGGELSSSNKAIIGGVVGGVGGAIFLGALGIVAWRLWGKKKRQQEAQDGFLGSGKDSVVKETRDSDLDRYHQPHQPVGGPVNTASNF